MYSCKPNTVIRFYTQPKSSSRHNSPQSFAKFLLSQSQVIRKYPDFVAEHQKFIIQDYKKKTQQIKNLKQRFPCSQRILQKSSKKSSRSSQSHKTISERQNKIKTNPQNLQKSQIKSQSFVNTVNIQYFQNSTSVKLKNGQAKQRLSQFQKNSIKRMKARQNMIIKKKCDSLLHQRTRNLVRIPQNIWLNNKKINLRGQQQLLIL